MSKFVKDLKVNVRSKVWWVTVISALIIICRALGFDLLYFIGSDWSNKLDLIFALGTAFGIHLNVGSGNNEVSPTEDISTIEK